MSRFVQFILRHRTAWLAGLAALTVAAGWQASELEFDFSFRSFFAEGLQQDEFARDVAKRVGNTGGSSLVAVVRAADVVSPTMLHALQAMSEAVETIPHVDRVYSLATIPFVRGTPDGVTTQPATMQLDDGADVATLRTALLASPLYNRRLISTDGTTTAILALLEEAHQGVGPRAPTITAFRAAVESHLPADASVVFTGYPMAEAEYARLVWKGFFAAELAGIILMAALLYTCYRTIPAVILPLATVGIATVLTLGFMHVVGQRVSFTNASVPLLILVIGLGEASFFIARYYEEYARNPDTSLAVSARTTVAVAPPGFVAAVTTSAGFVSLLTGHIKLTRDLGVALSAGILVTFVVTLILTPIVLSLLGAPPERATRTIQRGPIASLLHGIAQANINYRWVTGVAATMVFALGWWGAWHVNVAQYATGELPADNPVRTAQNLIDHTLSGTFETEVGLRRKDGGPITTVDALREVEALQSFLATQPFVIKTWSIVDYLKEMQFAMQPTGADTRHLPNDGGAIDQYLLLLSSGGRTSDVSKLLDAAHHTATIVVGTSDLGTLELLALHERVQSWLKARSGPSFDARFVGDYWLVSLGADGLIHDLFISTMTSFLIVFAVVAAFLRSWRLTLLSIPPNLLPLAAALWLMGGSNVSLRVGTSIILPVALGIAVDATMHYLARVREEWAVDRNDIAAMQRALAGTGRGMVFSASVLVFGFLCFLLPEFLVFQHIGRLGAWTLTFATLADLFLTPSLVLWFRPFRAIGTKS